MATVRSVLLCVVFYLSSASIAGADIWIAIDAPLANATVTQPFIIGGWAIDPAGTSNTGIDLVQVWAYPNPGSGEPAVFVGTAAYGGDRSDVAAAFGSQFRYSVYNLRAAGLAPKTYMLAVFAHSSVSGAWGTAQTVTVNVLADPRMWVDAPANGAGVVQPFSIGGWAVDIGSASGPGVNTVHVWAYPSAGGAPIMAGAAPYGYSRPDVSAAFYGVYGDGRFQYSGFSLEISSLPPGQYTLVSYAYSLVAGGFSQSHSIWVDVDRQVPAPSISASGGEYSAPVTVSSSQADASAQTYYTLDGSTPAQSSAPYTGAFTISSAASLRVKSFRSGWIPSAVSAADYTFAVAAPAFSLPGGTYAAPVSVTLSTATPGATVRWTTDGSDPTTSSNTTQPISLGIGTTTVKARAFRSGWTPSPVQAVTFVVTVAQVPPLVATPGAGTYEIGQVVTLATADPAVNIHYTLDGSEPTELSSLYGLALVFNQPATLKAKAFRSGHTPSALTAVYAIRVAQPTMTPAAGDYDPMPSVKISSTTSGATIRYTTDRNEPTEESPVYTGAFVAGMDMTVKAQVFKSGWAPSQVTTQTHLSSRPVEGSPAVVTPTGVSETGVNAVSGGVTFLLSGATLSADPNDAWVYHNGRRVPAAQVQGFSDRVGVPGILVEGRNDLGLEALDSTGRLVYDARTIWAGSRTLTVMALTASGAALAGATVTASLDGAGSVTASGGTDPAGRVSLSRLPTTSVVTRAEASGYRAASLTVPAGQTAATIRLDLANNDFSQNLSGWTVGTTNAYTLDHSETSQPLVACPGCATRSSSGSLVASTRPSSGGTMTTTADRDLVVDTMNRAGAQSVTRRFGAAPGTTDVSVRYRFQSDEHRIGQITGSYANDWYEVIIRTIGAGEQARDRQTVTSRWAQFDANHATPWYTLRLPVTVAGDTVEVTLTAANAVDNAYLGLLYADVVQETVHEITAFELNALHHPTDPYRDVRPITPLEYVSASAHAADLTSYGGYTRFHGTVAVRGPATDSLQDVWLEIVEGGTIVRADLARAVVSPARAALIGPQFGSDRTISLTNSTLLFELSAAQAGRFDQNTDRADLEARVVTLTTSGVRRERPLERRLNKLVQYTNTNRTPGTGRDLEDCALSAAAAKRQNRPPYPCGGDSWVLPSVRALVGQIPPTVTWNDFSKMNGGFFPPHLNHRQGDIADGSYPGYSNRDGPAAAAMLAHLAPVADRVFRVFVAYAQTEGNAFWREIRDKRLGRRCAREVLRPEPDHQSWFDIQLGNPLDVPPVPRSSCWPVIK